MASHGSGRERLVPKDSGVGGGQLGNKKRPASRTATDREAGNQKKAAAEGKIGQTSTGSRSHERPTAGFTPAEFIPAQGQALKSAATVSYGTSVTPHGAPPTIHVHPAAQGHVSSSQFRPPSAHQEWSATPGLSAASSSGSGLYGPPGPFYTDQSTDIPREPDDDSLYADPDYDLISPPLIASSSSAPGRGRINPPTSLSPAQSAELPIRSNTNTPMASGSKRDMPQVRPNNNGSEQDLRLPPKLSKVYNTFRVKHDIAISPKDIYLNNNITTVYYALSVGRRTWPTPPCFYFTHRGIVSLAQHMKQYNKAILEGRPNIDSRPDLFRTSDIFGKMTNAPPTEPRPQVPEPSRKNMCITGLIFRPYQIAGQNVQKFDASPDEEVNVESLAVCVVWRFWNYIHGGSTQTIIDYAMLSAEKRWTSKPISLHIGELFNNDGPARYAKANKIYFAGFRTVRNPHTMALTDEIDMYFLADQLRYCAGGNSEKATAVICRPDYFRSVPDERARELFLNDALVQNEVEMLDDLTKDTFENVILVFIRPSFCLRQILADLIGFHKDKGLPPAIICNDVDMNDKRYPHCPDEGCQCFEITNLDPECKCTDPILCRDPISPRVQELIEKNYDRHELIGKKDTGHIWGPLTLYTSKCLNPAAYHDSVSVPRKLEEFTVVKHFKASACLECRDDKIISSTCNKHRDRNEPCISCARKGRTCKYGWVERLGCVRCLANGRMLSKPEKCDMNRPCSFCVRNGLSCRSQEIHHVRADDVPFSQL